jgi:hypothetical protein
MVGNKLLNIYIAGTEYLRRRGMQFVTKLGENSGMFFIFPFPNRYQMWNQKVEIDLDLAFVDRYYSIRELYKLPAQGSNTPTIIKATQNTLFAIEANYGWFKKNGIKIGDAIRIIEI